MSKPQLEQMAQQYKDDSSKDVTFGVVYESDLGEATQQYSIRAFPTYVLFVRGSEVNRVEGVNFQGITAMIDQAGCASELTGGQSLGGGETAAALTPEQARAARLAKLGGGGSPAPAAPAPATSPAPAPQPVEAKKLAENITEDVEMKEAAATETGNDNDNEDNNKKDKMDVDEEETAAEPKMVDPTEKLNPEFIKTLTESMGFTLIRAQKGLLNGNGGTVEGAVEWLMSHQDDDDIDDPIEMVPEDGGGTAQSYKCNECGKILSNMANLELHAVCFSFFFWILY